MLIELKKIAQTITNLFLIHSTYVSFCTITDAFLGSFLTYSRTCLQFFAGTILISSVHERLAVPELKISARILKASALQFVKRSSTSSACFLSQCKQTLNPQKD